MTVLGANLGAFISPKATPKFEISDNINDFSMLITLTT